MEKLNELISVLIADVCLFVNLTALLLAWIVLKDNADVLTFCMVVIVYALINIVLFSALKRINRKINTALKTEVRRHFTRQYSNYIVGKVGGKQERTLKDLENEYNRKQDEGFINNKST